MANIFKAVANGIAKLYRWTFETDNVSVNPAPVSRTGSYRR